MCQLRSSTRPPSFVIKCPKVERFRQDSPDFRPYTHFNYSDSDEQRAYLKFFAVCTFESPTGQQAHTQDNLVEAPLNTTPRWPSGVVADTCGFCRSCSREFSFAC